MTRFNISKFNPQSFHTHITASELINAMGKKAFESFFSFAIVRNPWDWQVSLYEYMLQNNSHYQHELVKSFGSFDEYIRWRCKENVRYQKDFIYSEDGELLVNFIGRFERIDSDFKTICSRIGISAFLPTVNVSARKPYHQYYNDATTELVRRTFDADLTLFGYNF